MTATDFHQMETPCAPISRPDFTMAGLYAAWGLADPEGFAQWLLEPHPLLDVMLGGEHRPVDLLLTDPDLVCLVLERQMQQD